MRLLDQKKLMLRRLRRCIAVMAGLALPAGASAQLDLEGSVPENWSAALGSLSISGNHYKMGSQSLRWDWLPGDAVTIAGPGIPAADVTDFYKHTFDLWIHNPVVLPGEHLRFEFIDAGNTAQYYCDFHLDFAGWRRAVRSYRYDMLGPKGNANFDRVRIVGPAGGAGGTLFIDAVTWVADRFTRNQDAQNLDVAGYLSSDVFHHAHAELTTPDIPADPPTAGELADLATLRTRWLETHRGSAPSGSALNTANAAWAAMNIVEDGSGIRGQVITDNTSAYETWIGALAKDHYWNASTGSADKLRLFLRHWLDQGVAPASGGILVAGGSTGYDFRQTPRAFILGYDAYDPVLRDRVWQMLHWNYRMGDYWEPDWLPGGNTDNIYLDLRQQLGATLLLTADDTTAVQYVRGLSRHAERFLTPSHGTDDGIKVDGLGFHHTSHYNAYMYALRELSDVLYFLRGTQFQVDEEAYLHLRDAFFTMLRMSNGKPGTTSPGDCANAVCGRHPFSTELPFSRDALRNLGEWGGDVLGLPADPVVARAHNRLFGSSYALFAPYGVEDNPVGFYPFNYSPLGIYRQSDWVASIRGVNNDFWGTEIYSTANRYGRYQSYGALEILYPGGLEASGFGRNGWDWNKPPGTTTIVLPWNELEAENSREDVRSALNFAGALSFRGESGLYACNFQEVAAGANHNATFVWRKAWFCFSNLVICTGSDIGNNDSVHPTITTLFQGALSSPSTTVVLNGSSISTFPYDGASSGATPQWLLDAYGTGYYLHPGADLRLTRSTQTSPNQSGSGPSTTADHAAAWLNHGPAPAGAGYAYVVVPGTTAPAMAQLAMKYATPATTPYEILQRDATAHVVRWKEDDHLGYALFTTGALAPTVQTAGPLRTVTRPCLVMSQPGTGGTLRLTVVDPDLNLVDNISTPRDLDVTLAGQWTIDTGPTNALVLSRDAGHTTLRLQTVHGLPVDMDLIDVVAQPPVCTAVFDENFAGASAAGLQSQGWTFSGQPGAEAVLQTSKSTLLGADKDYLQVGGLTESQPFAQRSFGDTARGRLELVTFTSSSYSGATISLLDAGTNLLFGFRMQSPTRMDVDHTVTGFSVNPVPGGATHDLLGSTGNSYTELTVSWDDRSVAWQAVNRDADTGTVIYHTGLLHDTFGIDGTPSLFRVDTSTYNSSARVFGLTDLVVSQCVAGENGPPELTAVQRYASTYGLTGDDILEGADPDGDGHTNEQEFTAGTNPNHGADRLLATGTAASNGGAYVLAWASVTHKQYHAEYRDGFEDPTWHALTSVTASETNTMVEDPFSTGVVRRLYRVWVGPNQP